MYVCMFVCMYVYICVCVCLLSMCIKCMKWVKEVGEI